MSTGMESPIAPPPLTKRRWGLLIDAAYTINAARPKAGVTFPALGTDPVDRTTAEFCDDIANWDDQVGSIEVFDSFIVRASEACSALDVDLAWLNGRLNTRWNAMVSEAVAAELGDGAQSGSKSLASEATVAGYATSVEGMAGAIEDLLSDLHGAAGMVHLSPRMFGLLGTDFLTMVGDQWFTKTGHLVVADPGYADLAPEGETSDTTTGWIFTSGPVGLNLGDPRSNQNANEYLDRTVNRIHGRVIAEAVLAFDPATVSAVQVDLSGVFTPAS